MILKTKKLLALFLTSFIFILNGCTVEKETMQTEKALDYHLEQKSLKEVMNHLAFNNAYKRIPRKKNTKVNNDGRGDLEDQLGFTIVEQAPVTVIQSNGKTTYTLLIVSDNNTDNKIENLILNAEPNSDELGYIVKYNTPNNALLDANQIVQAGTESIEPLILNSTSKCETVINVSINCTDEREYCGGYDTAHGCSRSYSVSSSCTGLEPGAGGGTAPTGGGGLAGDSGSSSGGSGVYTSPTTLTYSSINLTLALSLNLTQTEWIDRLENSKIKKEIQLYLFNNIPPLADAMSPNSIAVNMSAFRYLNLCMVNPATNISQYSKWFSLEKPGIESDEVSDVLYWNNPSLTFPQQDLPEYLIFKSNFPDKTISSQMLCTNIGDEVLTLYNKIIGKGLAMNTCAIRLSYALNHSGISIPNVPGTKRGSDGKYYFTFASDLNKWMLETFGSNASVGIGPLNNNHKRYYYSDISAFIDIDPTNGNVLSTGNPLNSIQGIFSMVSNNPAWSTGHCDVLQTDSTCINNCHYEGPINYIDIWILP